MSDVLSPMGTKWSITHRRHLPPLQNRRGTRETLEAERAHSFKTILGMVESARWPLVLQSVRPNRMSAMVTGLSKSEATPMRSCLEAFASLEGDSIAARCIRRT